MRIWLVVNGYTPLGQHYGDLRASKGLFPLIPFDP